MSYTDRILACLWSVAPGGATNDQIARALGITSQQTVYMTTTVIGRRNCWRPWGSLLRRLLMQVRQNIGDD